jgi:UDP-glucose:(heptosyl)LPS alpha-1,3-glucosyltransferase
MLGSLPPFSPGATKSRRQRALRRTGDPPGFGRGFWPDLTGLTGLTMLAAWIRPDGAGKFEVDSSTLSPETAPLVRIGIIKSNYFPSGGGSERYTNGLIAELRRRGFAVEVFASRWGGHPGEAGVIVRPVGMPRGPGFARQLGFALRCRRAVRASACDIVFSLERTVCQDILRAGGGCHIEWLRQRARHSSPLRRLEQRLNPLHVALLWLQARAFSASRTGVVIANSHRGKAEIIRHHHFPAGRIFVVHNGVDGDRFKPAARPRREECVILLVGSGFERKGVAFAIRALARLPVRARLRVAGKDNPAPYVRLAAKLGIAERVEFLGATARMEEVYAGGDLLVHPALYEPFSNATLEAMACGLPVVTSRINGASEIVEPGLNGGIVEDPADARALARALEPFLDPERRERAGAAARQTAEGLPITLNVEKTLAVIDTFRSHPEWSTRTLD